MSATRQLAAIMFTDIAGYTSLMGNDERKAFELLKKNREIHKPLIKQYHGTWIKELGDGVLASFHTVTDAVFCAAAIHQTCLDVDGLQLRIGIHLGEVIFEDNDVFGDGVNIASRLQAMASPGSTWVSEAVYKNLVNKKEITSEFIKEETLKNVSEPVKVYEITVKEIPGYLPDNIKVYQQQSRTEKTGSKKSLFIIVIILLAALIASYFLFFNNKTRPATVNKEDTEKAIAVLPFKLIGNDEEGRYFAEGVADVLINYLHGIENLKVRSRTSVEKYAGTKKTIVEIAEELKVDYIIEGSAQKYKDDIRIIVQVINSKTNDHLWQKEYNKKFDDILSIQSEIALNIVSSLNITLAGTQKKRIEKIPTKSTEAWDLYLRGREYNRAWWKYHEMNDINFAYSFYSQAIKKDTTFALAYTWLADAIWAKEGTELENKKAVKDSLLYLIEKSIQFDPDLPDNYLFLGRFYIFQLKDFKTGALHLDKAIRMDPDNGNTIQFMGVNLAQQNKHLEALAFYKQAIQKEPTEFDLWLLRNIGWSYLCIGEFKLAEHFIEKALELEPDNLFCLSTLSHLQMLQGNYDGYLKTVNKSLSIRKDNLGLNEQGKAYLLLGDYVNAEKAYTQFFSLPKEKHFWQSHEKTAFAQALQKLGKEKDALKNIYEAKDWIEKNQTDPNYDLAKVYSFLGEKTKALDYLKKWKPDWGGHVWVEKDPLFENIKNEPEFKQLVQRFKSEIEVLRKEAQKKIATGEFPTIEMIRK
ncbi:MAG TPA: adenylate/guanylate cyclase domain-containing protein [Chitinophagaceae bacterium]|nr:adenylate/guanylate cyclase domain-containing protein [Chitinophagaceae bacterium]